MNFGRRFFRRFNYLNYWRLYSYERKRESLYQRGWLIASFERLGKYVSLSTSAENIDIGTSNVSYPVRYLSKIGQKRLSSKAQFTNYKSLKNMA